ncbi:MAG: alanine--glyoxylate aminotransferase family protein [Candidatus Bipolaricaulota bacterium]
MIPGPVEVEQDVLAEMGSPVVAHYGEEWTEIYNETVELARKVFQTNNEHIFLIPGSGSAGLDAALGSTLQGDRKLLVPINGWFGNRLKNIASTHSDEVDTIDFELGSSVDPDQVKQYLEKNPEVEVLAITHCETSTGVSNPVEEIGKICSRQEVLFIVDAVSSLGASQLKTDEWDVDICITASQKGLEAPPGLALVSVSPTAWELVEKTSDPGWYLNLKTWKKFALDWADWHPFPVTMAVNNVLALRRSLIRILDEGLNERFKRHKQLTEFLRESLRNLGFSLFVEDRFASSTVTSVEAGSKVDIDGLMEYLETERSIKIAGSLGEMEGRLFRIGHMGPGASYDALLPLLFGIEEYLRRIGADIVQGQFLKENSD